MCIRLSDLDILHREIAERRLILPVLVRDDRVFVAMINPAQKVTDELEFVTGKRVFAYVALEALARVGDRRGVRREGARRVVSYRAALSDRNPAQDGCA
ncbi:MAG: hypothetical protein U0165_02385 [Polyangiaceae bacterium]